MFYYILGIMIFTTYYKIGGGTEISKRFGIVILCLQTY